MSDYGYSSEMFTMDAEATLSLTPSYFPISVAYRNTTSGRYWELLVQHSPKMRVMLRGDEPKRDEIIEVLRTSLMPIYMIDVFEVLVTIAERVK